MALPKTLGELKRQDYRTRSVKDDMRANMIANLNAGKRVATCIVGRNEAVVPHPTNAVLAHLI